MSWPQDGLNTFFWNVSVSLGLEDRHWPRLGLGVVCLGLRDIPVEPLNSLTELRTMAYCNLMPHRTAVVNSRSTAESPECCSSTCPESTTTRSHQFGAEGAPLVAGSLLHPVQAAQSTVCTFTFQLCLAYHFCVLCFHTDFCTARPAQLDVGLALNVLLLITVQNLHKSFDFNRLPVISKQLN